MKKVFYVWKPISLTPLQIVNEFKKKNPNYRFEKISYAGRLDPMAEGILILLVGEENKKREKYLRLKKTYDAEIILGVSTDSFDGLGLINSINYSNIDKTKIEKALKKFKGKQSQIYPPFSSKAVNGKSLYWWARNGRLKEINLPKRNIEIYDIALINIENIGTEDLVKRIEINIKKVDGDFRQEDVIKGWYQFKEKNKKNNFTKIKIRVMCSTGTYVRRIASDLGKDLKCGAFAFSIKRINVGNISEKDCLNIL